AHCIRGSAACSGGLISALFQATESQGIFPSPAWLKVRGCKSRGVGRWATLVPAAPGWEICGLRTDSNVMESGLAFAGRGDQESATCS
ncbi:MAG: hypothetical protein ACP5MD_08455, partial [Verrucomicrobiia bacterium]